MDPSRFDQLSKSIASRSTRRSALSRLGLGGLLGAAAGTGFGARTLAANDAASCQMKFHAKTSTGTHKGKAYDGTLAITIGADGAIDSGMFDDGSGNNPVVVGQVTGRAINFRFDYPDGSVFAFQGTAQTKVALCQGDIHGMFEGPNESDLGKWNATLGAGAGSNGNSAAPAATTVPTNGGGGAATNTPEAPGGNANAATGGNANGGPGTDETPVPTEDPNAPDAANCPSGVVCGGACCMPAAGFTPDSVTCNGNSCLCNYSCGAANCPATVDGAMITVACGDAPAPQCSRICSPAPDNGNAGGANGAGNSGSTSSCPPQLALCDGTTPCCTAYPGFTASAINCVNGQCFCTYTCAQAQCPNPNGTDMLSAGCFGNPTELCANSNCASS